MPDSGVKVVTRQLSGNRTDHEENSAKVWALLPSFYSKKSDSEGDRVLPPPAPSPPAFQQATGGEPGSMADGLCIAVDVGLLASIYRRRR